MNNERNNVGEKRVYKACCDIYRDTDKVVLRLEMPGVSNKDLDVRVNEDQLIIRGTKNLSNQNGKYLVREIRPGDYYHEFTIDDTIDRNKIEASIKNGVVTLSLSIRESVKPRKIEVKAG